MTKQMNKEPYQQAYYPPTPTGITKYMRSNILWQLVRFAVINFKMLKLMRKSHRSKSAFLMQTFNLHQYQMP